MNAGRRFSFQSVAWLAALLPLAASNFGYLISASQELVPWCLPYLDGCTSISRASRHGIANLLFKGLMLPYAATLALFWWLAAQWLRRLLPERRRTRTALVALGIVAAVATATYAAALGLPGELPQFLRRYGTNFGFGCTVLAQIVLTAALADEPRVPVDLRRAMVALCFAMLALGVGSIPLQFLLDSRDAAVNAIEWTLGLLMLAYFPLAGAAWRRTGTTAPVPA